MKRNILLYFILMLPFSLFSQENINIQSDTNTTESYNIVPIVSEIDNLYIDSIGLSFDPNDDSPTSVKNVGAKYGGTRMIADLYKENDTYYIVINYYCNYIFTHIGNTKYNDAIKLIQITKNIYVPKFYQKDIGTYIEDKVIIYLKTKEFLENVDNTEYIIDTSKSNNINIIGKTNNSLGRFTYKFYLKRAK